jgi:TFIIIC subunit triple barrel domain
VAPAAKAQQLAASQDGPVQSANVASPPNTLQILSLASTNPFVNHDGQLYSCQWASTLGTDLAFAAPDVELPFLPLHRDSGFQIVSKSAVRLIGTPSKLLKRARKPRQLQRASNAQASASVVSSSVPNPGPSTTSLPDQTPTEPTNFEPPPISIPVPTTSSDDRIRQAAFLEQIATTKRSRSDADEVVIHRSKKYADFYPNAEETLDTPLTPRQYAAAAYGIEQPSSASGKRKRRRKKTLIGPLSASEARLAMPPPMMRGAMPPPMMHGALPVVQGTPQTPTMRGELAGQETESQALVDQISMETRVENTAIGQEPRVGGYGDQTRGAVGRSDYMSAQ